MRILVINPNTTASMTGKIGDAANRAAQAGTEIVAVNPADGPASIEGYYDEALCVPGIISLVKQHPGVDGMVISCFDDTGLDEAGEIEVHHRLGPARAGAPRCQSAW